MMKREIYFILLCSVSGWAKEPELPLCPPNIQFFPQNLPLHCRMPNKSDFKIPPFPLSPGMLNLSGLPSLQSPIPGQPPGVPFLPGNQPGLPGPGMPGLPGPLQVMPGMQGPMPQKLPVVVMPYYSQDPVFKKKKNRNSLKPRKRKLIRFDSDESSSEDSSTDIDDWNRISKNGRRQLHHIKRRKHKKKSSLLTPLLQYVTNDGYVVYEKQISNGEANSWMDHKQEIENMHHENKRVRNQAHEHENNNEHSNSHNHESEERPDKNKAKRTRADKQKQQVKSI